MKKILHFSDLHFAEAPWTDGVHFDKRWLGGLNYLLRRRKDWHAAPVGQLENLIERIQPDAIVCTGDLTTTGARGEFLKARKALEPVLEKYAERFIYVPGNHDCYTCCRTDAAALAETFSRLNGGMTLDCLPAWRTVGGMEFLMLQMCAPAAWYRSSGCMSSEAWTRLENVLAGAKKSGPPCFAVGHFPLRERDGRMLGWHHRFDGQEKLERMLLDSGVDGFFCGHIHHGFIRVQAAGQLRQFCSGSLTLTNGDFCLVEIVDSENVLGKITKLGEC